MRLTRAKRSTLGRRGDTPPVEEVLLSIREEYITLAQALKMAGVIGTGGEAKTYLAGSQVMVNGESEQRRGRKLRPGDLVVVPQRVRITIEAMVPGADGETTQEPEEE